ncbi:MAG: LuxR C-terminal-related transcriptional regulator [Pseudomonadota bacterium]
MTLAAEISGNRLDRNDLVALLDRSRHYSTTLLLAPAGFGKSTLLGQWQRRAQSRRMVRIDLSARDADPVHFFRRLANAVRQLVPGFDTLNYNPLGAAIDIPAAVVADSLLQAFEASGEELFVILDDFQHASSPLVQQVMATMLPRLPPQVHFLIASRTHPDFSLSRLKLDDRLLLIDGHDLRLTRTELDDMAGKLLGHPLPDDDATRLLEVTEGWVAGIKIALMAQARGKAFEIVRGSQPELVDYFAHVVLRELPETMRSFCIRAAVFERFSAELCDRVLERHDSGQMIERLRGSELFLQPVGEQPGWYRFHTLFQDFLKDRLCMEQPGELLALHRRAADCFVMLGDEERALIHAREAQDGDFFLRLLRVCCDQWLRKGDYVAILRWIGELPDETVAPDSELIGPLIAALVFSRRFNQAHYYLDLMRAQGNALGGRFADDATLPFLETMLLLFQHDTDFRLQPGVIDQISGSQHRDLRAFASAIIAYHHLMHARFDIARQYALQAKDVLEQLGYHYLESYADLILILCDRNTGRMLEAMMSAEQGFRRCQDARHTATWLNAGTALAVVRYEQNLLDDCQRLCEELVAVVNSACATEVISSVYLTLSRLLSHRGEYTRANRLLSQLEHILKLGNYDRFASQVACEEIRQALVRDDIELLERQALKHDLPRRIARGTWRTAPRDYDEAWERYGLAAALFLRAHGRLDDAAQILDVLSETLARNGVRSRAVVIDANRVVIRLQQGNENGALQRLARLVSEHGLICINRTAFDEAPGLATFMARSHELGNLALPEIYLGMFRSVLYQQSAQDAAEPEPATALLTAKEQEILALLRRGLSNNDISLQTGIALSTTKWHLKNIFAKLGVANRTEAVAIALPRLRTVT